MTLDFHKIARRWQRQWKTQHIYESDVSEKPKFMITTPYPYVNGLLHLGHTYTYMRVDAFARYKRMRGYNVLFPFGFHATGSPIGTAAQRIAEGEQQQINTLKLMGFNDEEIPAFKDPVHWIKTFSQAAEHDLQAYGMAIDWRRKFITTDLNPRYDKFIAWQFNQLKKKGLIAKGKHPVVWCPKENTPAGDHARSEGEGETPQEFLLFKHQLKDNTYVISATLRPDTVLGITNLYVNPETDYAKININNETWILGEPCAHRLTEQGHELTITGTINGKELIGKKVKEFDGNHVLILPATFLNPDFGTGLVHSVPSDSADDLIALWDLQKNEATCERYGLNIDEVKAITPIPILNTPEYGDIAAEAILKKYGVKSQNEREKLEQIKKELYKLSHYTATFNEKYKTAFSQNLEGKKVEEGKDIIRNDLITEGFALPYYQLSGKVICRCLTECIVKLVDNQWFLRYSDEDWKQQAHTCLQSMKLYPEKIRPQMDHVIDWLHDWACTREFGLGSNLPWDKQWKIESLSDSTIYNSFYTISHILKDITLGNINDKLFDYIFLGKGNPDELSIDKQTLLKMREEFTYWYPVDVRSSAKDLVQNHLTFYIFNHTAIFPEQYWPAGIAVNGYVNIQKQKMSKSKGIFKTLRDLTKTFSPDIVRISVLSTGEELNDVDWDPDLAETMRNKLEQFYQFATEHYTTGHEPSTKKEIDKWMEHQLHTSIRDSTIAMDETLFRTTLMRGFFDVQRHLKWYQRRTAGKMSHDVLNNVIEAQLLMLTPFVPHFCEELWHKLEKQGNIVNEHWPEYDENKINPSVEQSEALMAQVLDDVQHVLKLAKLEKPHTITFFVADEQKRKLFSTMKELLEKTRNIGEIMKAIMPEFKDYGQLVQKLVKDPSKLPKHVNPQDTEYKNLQDAIPFLKEHYNCEVTVIKEQESTEGKAKQAMPGKPAILVT